MNESVDASSGASKERPAVWHTILRGILLGMLAALVGSCLFTASVLVLTWLRNPSIPFLGWVPVVVIFWSTVFTTFAFLFVVVPGSVGGGMIALVLHILARRGKLTTRVSLIVGTIMGTCAGYLLVEYVKQADPDQVREFPEAVILVIGIAALAGLFHSWLLSRWLRKPLTQNPR